jgi:hypothetical protein
MGNSRRKLFENYPALVTVDDARAWFSITPAIRPKAENQEEATCLSQYLVHDRDAHSS